MHEVHLAYAGKRLSLFNGSALQHTNNEPKAELYNY